MSLKTILVPTEQHDLMTSTLDTALLLARRFDSYVEGFALQRVMVDVFAMEAGGAYPLAEVAQSEAEAARQARKIFDGFMADHGVPRSQQSTGIVSFGWLEDAPVGDEFVGSYGRVFDVTVLGRPGTGAQGPRMTTLESSLFESGRPVLIAPPAAPQRLGENILVAWNQSTEQARTTAYAMPLLRRANRVSILTVEGGTVAGPSGEQLARCLQFNGIAAQHQKVSPGNRSTGEVILAHADSLGCDLVIKGAYTQSRLRQLIFGGATRHILAHTTLPVLMAH